MATKHADQNKDSDAEIILAIAIIPNVHHTICNVSMLGSKHSQKNGQCTIMISIALLRSLSSNLQRQHARLQAFSDEWPVYDPLNLLLVSGHSAHSVEYLGYGKNLQRQHARVQAFLDEWPVHE